MKRHSISPHCGHIAEKSPGADAIKHVCDDSNSIDVGFADSSGPTAFTS